MSGFDVEPDMTRASVVDEKLSALLTGRDPVDGDELASELSWMIEQVNSAFPLPVMPEQIEDTHLGRMMEVRGELPVPVPARIAPVHASLSDRLRAGLSHKVAAAALAFTAAFGGAAYAGVLPAPVQEAVSNAAALVGLELPNAFEHDDDQDVRELQGVGDDYQPPDDAVDSGPDGPRSNSGPGPVDTGIESDDDDPDQEGNDDGDAENGAASDDGNEQDDSDETDAGSKPDSDEADGGHEPISEDRDGGDEANSDEANSDEPNGGDSSGTEDIDVDSPDEFEGSTVPGSASDDGSASDL